MSRAVMQQALEALEALKWRGLPSFVKDATTALRQALAEPEQEPVAVVKHMETGGNAGIATRIFEIDDPLRERLRAGTLLYTAPAPRKPEQEPVAWAFRYDDGSWHDPSVTKHSRGMLPLYSCAATPQRKPLTDEERVNLVEFCGFLKYSAGYYEAICVTHSVEAAHGITGEQK